MLRSTASPKRLARLLSAPVLVGLLAQVSSGQVLHVSASAPPGGDGSSWALAFADLQLALAAAPPGAQLWIASGTYRPHAFDRTVSFAVPSGVALYGGFAGFETSLSQRDPQANVAVLDGDLAGDDLPGFVNYGDNSHHVVTASGSVHVDGLTVRGGSLGGGAGIRITGGTVNLEGLVLRDNSGLGNNSDGGGLWVHASKVSITGCRFADNVSTSGGGALVRASDLSITGCRFTGNHATEGGGATLESPAGASLLGALLDGCSFEGNSGTDGGGIILSGTERWTVSLHQCTFRDGLATSGGAVTVANTRATLEAIECLFENNGACSGALYLPRGHASLDHCRFVHNGYRGGCGIGSGGGSIRLDGVGVTLEVANSSFHSDSRSSLWVESGGALLASFCTFHGDSSPSIRIRGGAVVLEHSLVWGASATQVNVTGNGTITATWSDVRMNGAGLPGTGNFEADPLFVDPANGDLHLAPGSPCIDGGDPLPIVIGTDFEQDSRVLDGDLDGDVRLDVGADEHAPVHLEVLGTVAPGSTLTFQTSGPPGLSAVLYLGAPGVRLVPQAGVVFLNPAGAVKTLWPAPPSSVPVNVPLGISGTFHVQELAYGGGVFALSNYVRLEF